MRSHFAVVAPRLSPTRGGAGFTKEREDFLKGELEWTERGWQECRGIEEGSLARGEEEDGCGDRPTFVESRAKKDPPLLLGVPAAAANRSAKKGSEGFANFARCP